MSGIADSLGLPAAVLIALVVLVAIQVTLQVAAVVSLVRTPEQQVTLGGRKWLWAIIIVLGEVLGPIAWFFMGRKPATVADEPVAGDVGERARNAADALYGPPGDSQVR